MGDRTGYENPLAGRYASEEMRRLFSDQTKFRTWRRIWIALARAEMELGLPITPAQVAELEAHREDIDYDAADALERRIRHDVMAHVRTFAAACPSAGPILHLGATSCCVTDNADLLILREALDLVRTGVANTIAALAGLAETWRDLPVLAFTHLKPAQPTTFGKRVCLWLMDFLLDLERLEFERSALRLRGIKGTTGTQASFLDLFGGDSAKVDELERRVAGALGFTRVFPVTGQTYPRKVDYGIVSALSGLGQSAHRFANDIRLLMHMGEVEEPFEAEQVGSSAMPYKRNPMRSERMTSLARYLISLPMNPAATAAEQWFERTLDDSANRRIVLPQAFLCADAVLNLAVNVARGLVVNPAVIGRNLRREMPFLATERILMRAVKKGGDRQALHEMIRVHAVAAHKALLAGAAENDLLDRLRADPAFASVAEDLAEDLDPATHVGRAPEQVSRFLAEHVNPVLARHSVDPDRADSVRV
jgi:adenylosuccinate lyase